MQLADSLDRFKPGVWVASLSGTDNRRPSVAKVRKAYEDSLRPGRVLLDLVMYDETGAKLGRRSPAGIGPHGFEPCCPAEFWVPVSTPPFDEMAEAWRGWRHLLKPLP
jgi:hypothetical protein